MRTSCYKERIGMVFLRYEPINVSSTSNYPKTSYCTHRLDKCIAVHHVSSDAFSSSMNLGRFFRNPIRDTCKFWYHHFQLQEKVSLKITTYIQFFHYQISSSSIFTEFPASTFFFHWRAKLAFIRARFLR